MTIDAGVVIVLSGVFVLLSTLIIGLLIANAEANKARKMWEENAKTWQRIANQWEAQAERNIKGWREALKIIERGKAEVIDYDALGN